MNNLFVTDGSYYAAVFKLPDFGAGILGKRGMSTLLIQTVVLVIVLIGAFVAFNFVMCRAFGAGVGAALREAMLWGVCFAVFAGVDYLMIMPSVDYSLLGS